MPSDGGVRVTASSAVDDDTLAFYRRNAQAYAGWAKHRHTRLTRFLALLPSGGAILELGCGSGADSAYMLASGFAVRPTDGAPEMAAEASRRLGRAVETLLFHELNEIGMYDGVWASACLLHVPRNDLKDVLARIWRALKPGGQFYASFKAGTGEGRDTLDRYYNYPSQEWLRQRYAAAGDWEEFAIEASADKGYDDQPATILQVMVRKPAV
jgi:SAM-dependent methyltransferase